MILTREQMRIETLRHWHRLGLKGADLARRYGVNSSLISNIKAGRKYPTQPMMDDAGIRLVYMMEDAKEAG